MHRPISLSFHMQRVALLPDALRIVTPLLRLTISSVNQWQQPSGALAPRLRLLLDGVPTPTAKKKTRISAGLF
jgi:hypothetical protein